MGIEEDVQKKLSEDSLKRDIAAPSEVIEIEKEYLRRLQETEFMLPLRDLKVFLHKLIIVKDFYDRRVADMRCSAERWKSLREQVMASECDKILVSSIKEESVESDISKIDSDEGEAKEDTADQKKAKKAKEKVEKEKKPTDKEKERMVLASSALYKDVDRLYHHYNRCYRFFEAKQSSIYNKHLNCKALLKIEDIGN